MKRGNILFLKVAIFVIGISILSMCIFFLPWLANQTSEDFPEFSYLHYPILIGLYVTAIPFFFALYQALRILKYIEDGNAFSLSSVKGLVYIKHSASSIILLYVIGSIFLLSQNALHPGIAIIGFIIIFASAVIALFSAVLQVLLQHALDIKAENDLTV